MLARKHLGRLVHALIPSKVLLAGTEVFSYLCEVTDSRLQKSWKIYAQNEAYVECFNRLNVTLSEAKSHSTVIVYSNTQT